MTRTSASREVVCPAQPRTEGRARTALRFVSLAIVASIYLLPFMRMVDTSDEGSLLVGAARIAHGQIFSRDFFEVMGPGTFYLLGEWFKLFGTTFVVARTYLFVNLLATAILIYYLSSRICRRLAFLPCAILAGAYFGWHWIGVSHHFDGNLYALLAVACLILWRANRHYALLVACGVLLAISTLIMQPKGALLLFAALLWLVLEKGSRGKRIPHIAIVLGSYLIVVSVVVAYFWSHGALESLIYADYLYPKQHYSAVNSVPYASGIFSLVGRFWVTAFGGSAWGKAMTALMLVTEILIALVPALVPILGARFRFGFDHPEVQLFWISGYALWLSEIHRLDVVHLTYGSVILIVLFAYFLEQYTSALARGATVLLYCSAGAFAFWSFTTVALSAKPIVTRAGTVVTILPSAAPVLSYLDENVPTGGEIFAYPYMPSYYFLSGTNNPTPYSILMYGYNTSDQFQQVIRILDERKVRIVVWQTDYLGPLDKWTYFDMPAQERSSRILEPYLMTHYRRAADFKGIWIMERIHEPETAAQPTTTGRDFGSSSQEWTGAKSSVPNSALPDIAGSRSSN
jgi:Dolichyl-phosphate-mannose-protein mannosyltransferase